MEDMLRQSGWRAPHEAQDGFDSVIDLMFGAESGKFSQSLALEYPPEFMPSNLDSKGKPVRATTAQALLWDSSGVGGGAGGGLLGRISPGWVPMASMSGGGYDIPDSARWRILQLARGMCVYNPLVSHAQGLFTTFSVGEGVKFNVGDPVKPAKGETAEPEKMTARQAVTGPADSRARKVLENFVGNPRNRGVMSGIGQQQVVGKFVSDGETFLALLFKPGDGSDCEIRNLDPLEIKGIYYNPEDAADPWVYWRQFMLPNGELQNRFYRDWTSDRTGGSMDVASLKTANPPWITSTSKGQTPADRSAQGVIRFETAKIYHVSWGTGRRGVSMLAAALPWAQAHKKFSESRVSIQQSLARFAWAAKTQGTPADVAAERARWQSTAGTGRETSPPPAQGSTLFQSKGVDYKPFPQDTGADSAKVDGGMLIQMFAISLGLFPHYMGSGEAFRLATATAMEPPMRKLFLRFQTIWDQVYTDIITCLFKTCAVPKKESYVRVDFPELWNVDVPALIDSIARLFQSVPWMSEIDEVVKILLMHIGVSDPQGLWNQIAPSLRGRIKKMNDARVIGPNGGATNASAGDDRRTPRPGGANSAGRGANTKKTSGKPAK